MTSAAPTLLHGLPAIANSQTRVLILGSFPGAASLAAGQYYAHPRNHFWPILAALLPQVPQPQSYPERCDWLLHHGIGVWDVYASCLREGSLDSAIRQAVDNDFSALHLRCPALALVAHNGQESYRHAKRLAHLPIPSVRLPSSSPANASMRLEEKIAAWHHALRGALPLQALPHT